MFFRRQNMREIAIVNPAAFHQRDELSSPNDAPQNLAENKIAHEEFRTGHAEAKSKGQQRDLFHGNAISAR